MTYIPYGRQNINQNDIDAVIDVLKSDFLTQGPAVPGFETKMCKYTGAKHGVAVNSATSALHIACLALGVGSNDRVWTSPNTFVASANCALYCGAEIDFVDIDDRTYNMSVRELEKKLIEAQSTGTLPKVVVAVDFAGQACDLKAMRQLADIYDFKIVEDASHAVGGAYLGKKIGCGEWADITILSFHPVKIITTAEGGMALTNNDALADKMRLLRSHGITRDNEKMVCPDVGDWYYEQSTLGFNYRMTELQAALGISQMTRIDEFVQARHELAERYQKLLSSVAEIILPYQDDASYSALHLYPIQIKNSQNRKDVFDHMRKSGIGVNVHYIPVHLQPWYQNKGFRVGDFPQAEKYYAGAISIPLYAGLTYAEQDRVITCLKEAL